MIPCISCGNPIGEKSAVFCDQCFNDKPYSETPAVSACQPVKSTLEEPKHSPLPWRVLDKNIVCGGDGEEICIANIEDGGGYEASSEAREVNAALIVRAVNNFTAMKILIERAAGLIPVSSQWMKDARVTLDQIEDKP